MDDVVNRFARELADAIAAAVAENPQVEACREKARAAGFEMKVTLEAVVGFVNRSVTGTGSGNVNNFVPVISGEHACSDETHPGPPYRTGGPLFISKKRVFYTKSPSVNATYSIAALRYSYSGKFVAPAYIPSKLPTSRVISAWGAVGWSATYPLHPVYQLGVSLIELKDLPGMVHQTKEFFQQMRKLPFTKVPRTVGEFFADLKKGAVESSGHYLNLQFGWVQFVQDLRFLLQRNAKIRKKMAWLRKQNGKPTKVSMKLDNGSDSTDIPRSTIPVSTVWPQNVATYIWDPYTTTSISNPVRLDTKYNIWFEAKWRFWIPELSPWAALNMRDHTRLEAELMGLSLDPAIIYKVIPWTWLVDWFSNVGSVLTNITRGAHHQVVAEYAYVMCEESYDYITRGNVTIHNGVGSSSGGWKSPSIHLEPVTTVRYEFKQRVAANPYGFGITYASLSAYQWSILAALGLSRRAQPYAPRS